MRPRNIPVQPSAALGDGEYLGAVLPVAGLEVEDVARLSQAELREKLRALGADALDESRLRVEDIAFSGFAGIRHYAVMPRLNAPMCDLAAAVAVADRYREGVRGVVRLGYLLRGRGGA